jgi:ribosome biogenesis GTPase
LGDAFPEIEQLAGSCRFDDCTHTHEPGCAVREAVKSGRIPEKRYENYVGMRAEMEALEGRKDRKAMLERKAKDRRFGKMVKRFSKENKKH